MTSSTLKLIAAAAMLIDHIAFIFGTSFTGIFFPNSPSAASAMAGAMRVIGRLTFPVMAFFVAEGCRKTGNIRKYMARLFGFGVVAQVPYILAFYAANNAAGRESLTVVTFFQFNVLFTLGLGVLAVYLYEKLERQPAAYIVVAITAVAADLFWLEYSLFGVLLVFAAYAIPSGKWRMLGMGAALSALYLFFEGGVGTAPGLPNLFRCLGALAALPLFHFYNGGRGWRAKYLFYVFYPAHLVVLVVVREVMRVM